MDHGALAAVLLFALSGGEGRPAASPVTLYPPSGWRIESAAQAWTACALPLTHSQMNIRTSLLTSADLARLAPRFWARVAVCEPDDDSGLHPRSAGRSLVNRPCADKRRALGISGLPRDLRAGGCASGGPLSGAAA